MNNLIRRFKLYLDAARLVGFKNTLISAKRIVVQKLGKYPKVIAIEPSSFCNLNCAFCITKELKVWEHRRKNFLSFDEFKRVVDNTKHFCYRMDFAFCGEPLMNPEIYKMFKYASDRGILTSLFTNATFLTEENIEKILDSGLHRIFTAFESFDKNVYEKTKVGAKYDVTMKNIKKLISQKKKRESKLPEIIIRMVVTKKNVDEIDAFINHVQSMGADAAAVKPLGIWPHGSEEYKRNMLNEYVPDHPMSRYRKDKNGNFIPMEKEKPCTSIDSPVLTSDGSIFLCWYDAIGKSNVGNVNENTFCEIWEKSKKFREEKMAGGNPFPFCKDCLGRGAPGKIIHF